MDGGIVAVRGIFVAHARRKVDGASNLLVEEDIAHGRVHERIETDSELAHIACALVGIEDGVELRVVARFAGSFHDFALLEHEADVAELLAIVKRGSIVLDNALDAPLHRRRIDFAVGNVHVAAARHRGNPLDAEADVGTLRNEAHLVGLVHEVDEALRRLAHLGIIGQAGLEIEVLERLGAHLRALSHGGVRPAEHAPPCLVHAVVERFLGEFAVHEHLFVAHIAIFHEVVGPADGDVGLHLLHLGKCEFRVEFHLRFACGEERLAAHAALGIAHEGVSARLLYSLDEFGRDFVGRIGRFDKDILARLEGDGIVDEIFGKLGDARICHKKISPFF